MTGLLTLLCESYAFALADAYAKSITEATTTSKIDVGALASFFHQRFTRESFRVPPDVREEFLSAVALELLTRISRAETPAELSLHSLEDSFKRATLTVLDTVRHRIVRARARIYSREHTLEDAVTSGGATSGPDLEALMQRELASRLSSQEAAVLYLMTEGYKIEDIAKQMEVSQRTIYRALEKIRRLLENYRREESN